MGKKGNSSVCVFIQKWILLCCFFPFQAFPADSQDQSCYPGDFNALVSFFRALDSGMEGWRINSTASSDCCGLAGVSCGTTESSGRRVIGLDLQGRSLRGRLLDSLADLDDLQWLNLSSNSLKGTVPAKIFGLPQLRRLDLSVNVFSGPIPAELYLPSIQVFNISFNAFNGSHPVLAVSANISVYDISYNMFDGRINPAICDSLPRVQVLLFSSNLFSGELPAGLGNCTSLEELSAEINEITGNLPLNLFKLSSLRRLSLAGNQLKGRLSSRLGNLFNLEQLDLSFNAFLGTIPDAFGSLTKLEYLSLQSNTLKGSLPSSLLKVSSLRVFNLRNNSLSGDIKLSCVLMANLSSIDLGTNFFTGPIPSDLSYCMQLKTLNLARNNLSGEVPISFKNLASLSYISLSNNSLSNLSSALEILQDIQNLTGLVLTKNFHDNEKIPMERVRGFGNLELLVIASCGLSGSVPVWLANCKKLKVLDLSWNHLNGTIPPWIGNLDSLFYLDLSNNSLGGEIPASLTRMKGLISSNISQQDPPSEDFPLFLKRNSSAKGLQYNQVSSFPPSIVLCKNMLVGSISPGFGNLKRLHVLDLSKNKLSGTIPDQLSDMSSIESLDLSHNNLTGKIPLLLTRLNFLSSFSVAYNKLIGMIPIGGQFSTFSSLDFEGNPGLCGFHLSTCSPEIPEFLRQAALKHRRHRGLIIGVVTGIGLGTALLLLVALFIIPRTYRWKEDTVKAVSNYNGDLESAGPQLVLLFQNKDNKELSIEDILKSTNHFDQANIVGCGGFGLVYKATLPDGRKVAIKRLSGDYGQMEREFQAEVEALSRAQHKNLVLLQGYCRIGSDRLLIYSYMENGSLDYWLHEKHDGGSILDWQKRLWIAQGAVRGLAYLHHSCDPHILHRDIKSSNILLNSNFEAHLADFGLARLILPYDTHVTTDLVGTLGYIPPEYGQSSVATFKGDVYSFGVVLLELLTGKRPVDMSKPRGGRELISWVLQMKEEKREDEVVDPLIYDKSLHMQQMQLLDIACLCISGTPKLRPLTKELVAWLEKIDLQ